jgi:hypothetical protein
MSEPWSRRRKAFPETLRVGCQNSVLPVGCVNSSTVRICPVCSETVFTHPAPWLLWSFVYLGVRNPFALVRLLARWDRSGLVASPVEAVSGRGRA